MPGRKVSGKYFLFRRGFAGGTRAPGGQGWRRDRWSSIRRSRRFFVCGIVPVVPSGGVEVGGEFGVDVDDVGVKAPLGRDSVVYFVSRVVEGESGASE